MSGKNKNEKHLNNLLSCHKTMDDIYKDGSDHLCCPVCGLCKTCRDCEFFGCGEARRFDMTKKQKELTKKQKELTKKYGTPEQFKKVVEKLYNDYFLTTEEKDVSINNYTTEWRQSGLD